MTVLDLSPIHSDRCSLWNNKDPEPRRDEGQRKHEKLFGVSIGEAVLKARKNDLKEAWHRQGLMA